MCFVQVPAKPVNPAAVDTLKMSPVCIPGPSSEILSYALDSFRLRIGLPILLQFHRLTLFICKSLMHFLCFLTFLLSFLLCPGTGDLSGHILRLSQRVNRLILFPLLGTGTPKGNLNEILERLINAAITYMETTENSSIETIFFQIWTDIELETCKAILEVSDKLINPPT